LEKPNKFTRPPVGGENQSAQAAFVNFVMVKFYRLIPRRFLATSRRFRTCGRFGPCKIIKDPISELEQK
jgi:hypothetical protein